VSTSLRTRYLDNADTEVDHRAYWAAVVENIGEEQLRRLLPVSKTPAEWRALIERDGHLNNVPLKRWDAMHELVRRSITFDDAHVAITGWKAWSLSDTVCVLKECARRYAESEA